MVLVVNCFLFLSGEWRVFSAVEIGLGLLLGETGGFGAFMIMWMNAGFGGTQDLEELSTGGVRMFKI